MRNSAKNCKYIGQMMVAAGLVSAIQVQEALNYQEVRGGKIAGLLMELGYLDRRAFTDFMARQPGVASIDIGNYHLSLDLLEVIPREIVLAHEIVPLDKLGPLLTVGMACPLDTETIAKVEEVTGLRVKPLLCCAGRLRVLIDRYYRPYEEEICGHGDVPCEGHGPCPELDAAASDQRDPLANVTAFTMPRNADEIDQAVDALEQAIWALRELSDKGQDRSRPAQMSASAKARQYFMLHPWIKT